LYKDKYQQLKMKGKGMATRNTHAPFIKAVFFDFDGTLTLPGAIDFETLKKHLSCPPDQPVLEFIKSMPAKRQTAAMETLDQFEIKAAKASLPHRGAEQLLLELKVHGIKIGIITRNCLRAIQSSLDNFKDIKESDFDVIISRDDPVPPKPSPYGLLKAIRQLDLRPAQVMMVGDYLFDVQAGAAAGVITVLMDNKRFPQASDWECDYRIESLGEIIGLWRNLKPLPGGKLPNDLLAVFLPDVDFKDSSVLIPPGVGQDTAAIDISQEEVVVLKSDPITFATDAAAQYAVLVNANDIVTSGAVPRWFLATLLFPIGSTAHEIKKVMTELNSLCRAQGILLCGGHTEITDAVSRPVISGMMVGSINRDRLIDKRHMQTGDVILFSKGVCVEGTAIIAREFGFRLIDMGMTEHEINECRLFLSQISILEEAAVASQSKGVTAMHDVTEGGLATAVNELGIAGGHRLKINMDAIPIYHQTAKICRLLNINPYGLIGSGSLLISCHPSVAKPLMAQIQAKGINIVAIGEVLEAGEGIQAFKQGQPCEWPSFGVDEITHLF
jgi:HAD superfamily hydrolase (TIGR01549 family)